MPFIPSFIISSLLSRWGEELVTILQIILKAEVEKFHISWRALVTVFNIRLFGPLLQNFQGCYVVWVSQN